MPRPIPIKPPHFIHADTEGIYPTHTHNLEIVGLPNLFINNGAFGPTSNAVLINELVIYLYKHEDAWNDVINRKEIKIDLWSVSEFPKKICVRPVNNRFRGVRMAYPNISGQRDKISQIYVEGDDHVLVDSYFENLKTTKSGLKCGECQKQTIH